METCHSASIAGSGSRSRAAQRWAAIVADTRLGARRRPSLLGAAGRSAVKAQLVARLTAVTPTVAGQSVGREFPLDGREMRVGRAPSCEINLDGDPLVSRFHAVLRPHEGVYSITDLGSSNGTLVNDAEIHAETPLHEGDEVTIGECRMRIASSYFEIDTAHVPHSQPLVLEPVGVGALSTDDPFAFAAAPTGADALDPFAMRPPLRQFEAFAPAELSPTAAEGAGARGAARPDGRHRRAACPAGARRDPGRGPLPQRAGRRAPAGDGRAGRSSHPPRVSPTRVT